MTASTAIAYWSFPGYDEPPTRPRAAPPVPALRKRRIPTARTAKTTHTVRLHHRIDDICVSGIERLRAQRNTGGAYDTIHPVSATADAVPRAPANDFPNSSRYFFTRLTRNQSAIRVGCCQNKISTPCKILQLKISQNHESINHPAPCANPAPPAPTNTATSRQNMPTSENPGCDTLEGREMPPLNLPSTIC